MFMNFGSRATGWRLSLAAFAAFAVLQLSDLPAVSHAQAQDRFVFANESDYDTVDPHAAFDVGRVAVRLNLYDGLMRWQGNPAELVPWVAESYDISDDGLEYTFHLRQGVLFHDGTEVTADDVVYSLERILALGRGAASLLGSMVEPGSAEAVDDYTVRFTLEEPSAIFLSVVPEIHIVNSELVKANADDGQWGEEWLSTNDAGSGAYQLTQFDPAIGFAAQRFPDHFMGWGDKWIDEIEFRGVADTNTRVLGLIRGDYQGMGGYLQSDQIARILDSGQGKILEEESMRIMLFQINTTREPLNDVHVRRALNYVFDYEGFNEDILEGMVERNPTPLPNTMWGVPEDVEGYEYDLEKAQAELDKAAVEIDRPIEIAYLVGFEQTEQAATVMQTGLRRLGLDANVVGIPWPVIVDRFGEPETTPDVSVYWISTYYADPHNWVGEMYHSGNRGTFKNASHYANPEVDELFDKALRATEQDERAQYYKEATRIIVEDAPGVWIYNTMWFGPFASNVEGIAFSPIGNGQEMRTVYFSDQ